MKVIGEYILRGSIERSDAATNPETINLNDGSFETGFRVMKFQVYNDGDVTTDVEGALGLADDLTPIGDWDFGDNREIGWSVLRWWDFNVSSRQEYVDPNNMIIEDLYLYCTNNQRVNYVIELVKYDITDWEGALALATARQS